FYSAILIGINQLIEIIIELKQARINNSINSAFFEQVLRVNLMVKYSITAIQDLITSFLNSE
ncbi:MAG TPA: hypothetical protein V6C85_21590, partial [Allocoleopsis sp.]